MYRNKSARVWKSDYNIDPDVLKLHQKLPNYAPTPLLRLPDELTRSLITGPVFLKDESDRFGLPAFKILGASWATYRAVTAKLHLQRTATFEEIRDAAKSHHVVLHAATDGNFGRAMGRMASLIGCTAKIYVPKYMVEETKRLIASEGAEVLVIQGDYDDAVRAAGQDSKHAGGVHIQDNAWPGYEEIPTWVAEGYSTMMVEIDHQVYETVGRQPDLVVVPVGVGSLAHAVVAHCKNKDSSPFILAVEPETAACLKTSLERGEMTSIVTSDTNMCGMCCGTVSSIAWPVLQKGVDASITVNEAEAESALRRLHTNGISTGPCSAGTLAALYKFHGFHDAWSSVARQDSVVVLMGTEGPR